MTSNYVNPYLVRITFYIFLTLRLELHRTAQEKNVISVIKGLKHELTRPSLAPPHTQ